MVGVDLVDLVEVGLVVAGHEASAAHEARLVDGVGHGALRAVGELGALRVGVGLVVAGHEASAAHEALLEEGVRELRAVVTAPDVHHVLSVSGVA